MKFRARPKIIDAIRWTGGDYSCLDEFCGKNWGRADAVLDAGWPSDVADDEQVVVYNSIDHVWLPVAKGSWIIRGTVGELYPCHPDVFSRTYVEVV